MKTDFGSMIKAGAKGLKAFAGLFRTGADQANLCAHIPGPMQIDFANGGFDFEKSMIMQGAVVGIVDMVSSTTISNAVDMLTEFNFKREFQRRASARASENGIVILNHTGDGFVFLANYHQRETWQNQVLRFHRSLNEDFQRLLNGLRQQTGHDFQSGLRFGVASGNVILGFLSSNPAHFTAVGAVVNLVLRQESF